MFIRAFGSRTVSNRDRCCNAINIRATKAVTHLSQMEQVLAAAFDYPLLKVALQHRDFVKVPS